MAYAETILSTIFILVSCAYCCWWETGRKWDGEQSRTSHIHLQSFAVFILSRDCLSEHRQSNTAVVGFLAVVNLKLMNLK